MYHAIKIVSSATGERRIEDGMYVAKYDPNGRNGRGDVVFTPEPEGALKFATAKDVLDFYQQVSTTHPLRPDGKPNRPLTAYTVEIVKL